MYMGQQTLALYIMSGQEGGNNIRILVHSQILS